MGLWDLFSTGLGVRPMEGLKKSPEALGCSRMWTGAPALILIIISVALLVSRAEVATLRPTSRRIDSCRYISVQIDTIAPHRALEGNLRAFYIEPISEFILQKRWLRIDSTDS